MFSPKLQHSPVRASQAGYGMQCSDQQLNWIGKSEFVDWLRSLQQEERYLVLKIKSPGLAHTIRHTLRRIEQAKQDHSFESKLTNLTDHLPDVPQKDTGDARSTQTGQTKDQKWVKPSKTPKQQTENRPNQQKNQQGGEAKDGAEHRGESLGKCTLKGEHRNRHAKKNTVKNALDSLVFVSDGEEFYDSICFDCHFIECPDKLYELLVQHEGNETSSSDSSATSDLQRISESKSLQELSHHVMLSLRREVFTACCRNMQSPSTISISLDVERKRKKEFSLYWKNLSEQAKRRLLYLDTKDIVQLSHIVNERSSIPTTPNLLDKEITELLKLQRNQFCNRIFKCKTKKVLSANTEYYELVYNAWKNEIEKMRKRRSRNKSYNTHDKHDKGTYQETVCIERDQKYEREKEFEKLEKLERYNRGDRAVHEEINRAKRHKSISAESNETNETDHGRADGLERKGGCLMGHYFTESQENRKGIMERSTQVESRQEAKEEQSQRTTPSHLNPLKSCKVQPVVRGGKNTLDKIKKHPSSTVLNCTPPKLLLSSLPYTPQKPVQSTPVEPKPQQSYWIHKSEIEQLSLQILQQQLIEISDQISEEANKYHERRLLAFERIQSILQMFNIPIKLFGSCASGIATRNSDIDIAVDASIIACFNHESPAEKLRAALQHLEGVFQDYGWITALNLIKKAAVPVIKMSVDTSIPFICPHYYYYLPTLNREHNAGPIEIDLTIESYTGNECNHLGLISTAAINQWLAEIATLHTIIIIMKQYFVNRKLNVTYEGGLKTYAMIVMIVAYIRHADLQLEENPAKVLRRLAEFYEKFDEAKQGINIDSKPVSQIFYMKETKSNEGMNKSCEVKNKSKADLEIHDPMNHGKIMTQSCYSFPEIKQLFKDIINLCYHSTDNELLGLFTSFDWQVCRCDIGESKKCFQMNPMHKETNIAEMLSKKSVQLTSSNKFSLMLSS